MNLFSPFQKRKQEDTPSARDFEDLLDRVRHLERDVERLSGAAHLYAPASDYDGTYYGYPYLVVD